MRRDLTRIAQLAVLLAVSACPRSATTNVDAKTAADVKQAGWSGPYLVAEDAAVRVLVASKGRARHVLLLSPAGVEPPKVVDGGEVKDASAKVSARFGGAFADSGATQITIAYDLRAGGGASRHQEWIWLVRPGTLEIACVIRGEARTDPGKQCGSGAYDWVSVERVAGTPEPTYDVRFSGGGTYSELEDGRCVERSPVTVEPRTTRYTLPASGSCTQSVPPAPPATDEEW